MRAEQTINWTDCSPSNFYIWKNEDEIFGECFFNLCLELPSYSLLLISSVYYLGRRQFNYHLFTNWNQCQNAIIYMRALVISCLVLTTISGLMVQFGLDIFPLEFSNIVLTIVKTNTWLLHLLYTLRLKRGISYNCRGPKPIVITWTITAIISILSLRDQYSLISREDNQFTYHNSDELQELNFWLSAIETILQFLYLLTLIPGSIHLDQRQFRALLTDAPSEPPSTHNQGSSFYIAFNEDEGPLNLGIAKENTNIISRLFFRWVNQLMRKGSCGYLSHTDDLYDLPSKISTSFVASEFQKHLIKDEGNLFKSLFSCFGFEFLSLGILKILADACKFLGPILLNLLLNYIENDKTVGEKNEFKNGFVFVFGMLCSSFIGSLCSIHFDFNMMETVLKIRAAVTTSIYQKTLRLRQTSIQKFSSGEIINFLSIDTNRIINFCPSFHSLWSLPVQVAVTLYLLHTQIGIAFLAGVFFAVLLIPINKFIANKIGTLSVKMMKEKDGRVKIMSEILHGIRTLKYHSWEMFFANRVNEVRKRELSALKGRKYLDALCVYFWATTPVLVSLLSFGTYVLLGNTLTAAKVFTSLALFNMLIGPLNALPWVINGIVESWVSLRRVSTLLKTEETSPESVYSTLPLTSLVDLSLKRGKFLLGDFPSSSNNALLLKEIDVEVKEGQFIGIVGEVGSGKSSILLALLGELTKIHGTLGLRNPSEGFGVVFQEPWIQRGNIRRNILFGKPYDYNKYRAVVEACCLQPDFDEMEDGDETICSSTTLSGGQKVRINLARAVYQEKSIYLLDDVFSAVDSNVAWDLYHNCLMGILKHKTRIVVTHHVKFLRSADLILVVDNGKIINRGPPVSILPIFYDEEMIDEPNMSRKLSLNSERCRSSLDSKSCNSSELKFNTASCDLMDSSMKHEANQGEETQCKGVISLKVYKCYWEAIGKLLSVGILFFLFLMQATKNASDLWLAHWVSSNNKHPENITTSYGFSSATGSNRTDYNQLLKNSTPNTGFSVNEMVILLGSKIPLVRNFDVNIRYYFTVFILIGIANSFCALGRAFTFAYGCIEGGRKLHVKVLRSILQGNMKFFDNTPIGRVLNRFSSDVSIVDDSLPFILNILLAQVFGLAGTLFLTTYALPWILVFIIPLLLVLNNIQIFYRHSARQCRRIESVSLSPVYAHFSETLKGVTTIRAMRASERFEQENELYLEANQRARYSTQAVASWLAFRLQMVGVVVITGVGIVAVIQHRLGIADPGVIGLAISYALTITSYLSEFITSFTETEKEMIAVERVHDYITNVPTEGKETPGNNLPYMWPLHGVISFKNVSLRHRSGSPYALRNISFESGPCEKIGIVGRTGAGKSSLFQVLFRLVDNYEGDITIDSLNTRQVGINSLRSKMWVVPQDPFIFSGTLRDNLDPRGEFSDETISRVIQKCQIMGLVRQLGGLDGDVGESGAFLSAGQKQLVQLARAILVNPKILCIDEATANVDHETDKIIQATIKTSFRTSTVLIVAHRVTTILHSHRVIVMKNGSIVEIDAPEKLMVDKSSHFYELAQGNFE